LKERGLSCNWVSALKVDLYIFLTGLASLNECDNSVKL